MATLTRRLRLRYPPPAVPTPPARPAAAEEGPVLLICPTCEISEQHLAGERPACYCCGGPLQAENGQLRAAVHPSADQRAETRDSLLAAGYDPKITLT